MDVIANLATQDQYVEGLRVENVQARSLSLLVGNASVLAKFRPTRRESGGDQGYGPEVLITATSRQIENCSGAMFRSAVAGVPARIMAILYGPDDPQIGSGIPFTGTLEATGATTNAGATVIVEKDGAVIGTEPTLDFLTGGGLSLAVADDAANSRVTVQLAVLAAVVDQFARYGSVVGLTNGAGDLAVSYGSAFPTATDALVVCNGDVNSSGGYAGVQTPGNVTAAGFIVRLPGLPNTNVRVNYIAIGH